MEQFDDKNFPSLSNVLQNACTNTEVVDAINQLLTTYQPDDGLNAYEHVLKTLLVLSKNFNTNTRNQIISIVPLPKGVSSDIIRSIICKITGLIGTSMSMYHKITAVSEDEFNAKILEENTENIIYSQNTPANVTFENPESDVKYHRFAECKTSPKPVPSVSDVFRGFPSNENSTIHSPIKNVNYAYDTLDYNVSCLEPYTDVRQNFSLNTNQQTELLRDPSNSKCKCLQTPHFLYKSESYQVPASCQQGIFKPLDNECFQVAVTKTDNCNNYDLANTSQSLYQDNKCFEKHSYSNDLILNEQEKTQILHFEVKKNNKLFSQLERSCCEFLRAKDSNEKTNEYYNNIHEDETSDTEIRVKQTTIQEDIYKMDYVQLEKDDQNVTSDTQACNTRDYTKHGLIVHKKLKTSLQHFLQRAKQDISIEFPSLHFIKPLHNVHTTSKCDKLTAAEKDLENDKQLNLTISRIDKPKRVMNIKDIMILKGMKKLIHRKTFEPLNCYPQLEQCDQVQTKILHKHLDLTLGKAQLDYGRKKDIANVTHRCTMKRAEQNKTNILQQTASITELATFKKQYYDTLLSIQKAKVAVANSLAFSSVESTAKYDPYYLNYSYQQQQQQLRQQQGQLTTSPQFAVHTTSQSGLSHVNNASYTWMRYNNYRHPVMRQLRFQRQPSSLYSKNKDGLMPQYTGSVNVQHFVQDKNTQAKQCVQRKKLEDIVGKLKEVENSNENN